MVRDRTFRAVFLKGNHESYLTGFTTNPLILDEWQQFGGLETLESYGIVPSINTAQMLKRELAAVSPSAAGQSQQISQQFKIVIYMWRLFFVHAGVRPGIPLTKQREEDLLWICHDFLLCEEEFSKIIVHGHTPMLEPDIRPNRINIDTGAYATGRLPA